ncbi:hypothetical protein TA3x_001856 [Tundrisphaera sp. TA3]|uniref:hypothetical protein n=1 Tax=Tundrisphaera sp. TA3 TaxID=3435775 RepID=UPI003EBCDA71
MSLPLYNGTPGDATSCSGPNFHGKMNCGYPGKTSELTWSFSGHRGDQDIDLFARKYPSDAPNAALTSREAAFSGERIILFQDANQTILIDPPASPGGNPRVCPLILVIALAVLGGCGWLANHGAGAHDPEMMAREAPGRGSSMPADDGRGGLVGAVVGKPTTATRRPRRQNQKAHPNPPFMN